MLFRIVIFYRREPLRKKKEKKFNTHLSFDYKISILLKKNLNQNNLTYKKSLPLQPKSHIYHSKITHLND
jgi:hypothetical protein